SCRLPGWPTTMAAGMRVPRITGFTVAIPESIQRVRAWESSRTILLLLRSCPSTRRALAELHDRLLIGYDRKAAARAWAVWPRNFVPGSLRMPEDLLQELETPHSVAGTLEGIEGLVREAVRQAPHVNLAMAG